MIYRPRVSRSLATPLASRRVVVGSLVALAIVLAVGFAVADSPGWTSGELRVVEQLNREHTPFLDTMALAVNWLFSPAIAAVVLLLAAALVCIATRRWRVGLRVLLTAGLSWLGSDVIKRVIQRPRPDQSVLEHTLIHEVSASYPSGHTAFVAALGFALVMLLRRSRSRWRLVWMIVAALCAVTVGLTRIYLGVHYPTDVAASIVYAAGSVIVITAAWEWGFSLVSTGSAPKPPQSRR